MNPDLDGEPDAGSTLPAVLTFEALSDHPHCCRWPLEGGWCGAATSGRRPYCLTHIERAYLPREPELERDAAPSENTSSNQDSTREVA